MSFANWSNVEDEIINHARSLVKDPSSRHTNYTNDGFTASASQTTKVLTHDAICINSITVDAVAQVWGTDFTYSFSGNKTITFTSAFTGGETVTVDYDYNYYWGYWGYPATSTSPGNYPIFGITWLDSPSDLGDAHGDTMEGQRMFRVWVYAEKSSTIKTALQNFRDYFHGKTNWYLSGVSYKRVFPVGMFREPEPDTRRKGTNRWLGSFQDFKFITEES